MIGHLVWFCSTDLHCLRKIASRALSGSVGSEVVLVAGVFDGDKGVDTSPERDLALWKRWVLMHSLVSTYETSGSGVPSPSTLKLIKVCRPRMDCLWEEPDWDDSRPSGCVKESMSIELSPRKSTTLNVPFRFKAKMTRAVLKARIPKNRAESRSVGR